MYTVNGAEGLSKHHGTRNGFEDNNHYQTTSDRFTKANNRFPGCAVPGYNPVEPCIPHAGVGASPRPDGASLASPPAVAALVSRVGHLTAFVNLYKRNRPRIK